MKKLIGYLKRLRSEETGAVAVFIAISLVVLMSLCSFAVDTGIVYYEKSKLQSAVDAAALAAAHELPNEENARRVAVEYLEKNGFSVEDAKVEVLENNTIVRVTDSNQTKTLFASLFNVDRVNNSAVAAAKYAEKQKTVNFPFLLFSGSKRTNLFLGGQFHIHGSVHANSSVQVGASTSSTIETLEACGSVSDNNRIVKGGTISGADYYDMPDYDEDIMAMIPPFPTHAFNIKDSWPVPTQDCHMSSSNKPTYYRNLPGTIYSAALNTYTINRSIHVLDNFATGDKNIVIFGDVYCEGDFAMDKFVTIHGNLYVKGSLKTSGATQLIVSGNVYSVGDIRISSNGGVGSVFGGDIYTEGLFDLAGSCCIQVSGSLYVKRSIMMQSSSIYENGQIEPGKIFRHNIYAGSTCTIYGVADVYGDIISGSNLEFTGNYPSVTTHGGVIYSGGVFKSAQGFNTNGVFVAEGNIEIGGMPSTINSTSATVALYSRNGNITLSPGTGMVAYGMVYAPKGRINFYSGNMTFYGSIIADTYGFGPGGLQLGENPRKMPFEPNEAYKVATLVE